MARSSSPAEDARPEETDKATKRVVLRRERVFVIPDAATQEQIDAAVKAAKDAKLTLHNRLAWVEVGEFEGKSKTQAIEAHAGKPGTPDAKPGAYKAPGVSAWNGGALYEAPPQPLVQRKPLD